MREAVAQEAVVVTRFAHEQAMLEVQPGRVNDVLRYLRDEDTAGA